MKLQIVLATLLLAFRLAAQVSTASIQGLVRDTTGASIPNASLELKNRATGVATTTSTNSSGEYALVNIQPGRYDLLVTKEGFQATRQGDFVLSVSQSTVFDFTLIVGSADQTVTVQDVAPTIESSTAELGTVMGFRQVNDLPLNGRNFTQLLALTPGASPINTAQTFGFRGVERFPSLPSTVRATAPTCFSSTASWIRHRSPATTRFRPSSMTFRNSR